MSSKVNVIVRLEFELSSYGVVIQYISYNATRTSLSSTRESAIYIYIYIVIHRQTVSFYQNSSVWLDPQDARSRDRNPSNFTID